MTERRSDYIELAEIKVLLATVVERLDNVVTHFEKHQADDVKVADRVRTLEQKEARLDSRIVALSAACTAIGFIVGKLPIKWF